MALTTERDTKRYENRTQDHVPLAANAVVFQGGLVCVDATGYLVAGATATGLIAAGRAEQSADNTGGANGDKSIDVTRGVFAFDNSTAGDEIVQADLYADCYIVSDHQVAKTDGGSSRSVAGKIVGLGPAGSNQVWVQVDPLA